jgi:heme exporter protein D
MYFDTFAEFLQMGKHGAYVWSSYGISALLIGLNILFAVVAQRNAREEVKRLARRQAEDRGTE